MSQKDRIKLVKTIGAIIIMIILMFVYSSMLNLENNSQELENKLDNIFKNVDSNMACIELYTIYGNHLNINGYVLKKYIQNMTISDIKLILERYDGQVLEYNLQYIEQEDRYKFCLSNDINEGIDLNSITTGEYVVFVKVEGTQEESLIEKYFSLDNLSDYTQNEYYTLTKDNINYKINISFNTYSKGDYTVDYMKIISQACTLPKNIVDIVIDPGHGGSDCGAVYDNYKEADFTLEYSLSLKEKLESLGYKVRLTRDNDVYTESYGENGRAVIPYSTKAKLVLSIHLNSTTTLPVAGGVEIYAPNNASLNFAKSLADNIVNYAQTKYSVNSYARVMDGVYVRTYTQEDIEDAKEYAKYMGYEFYENLTTQTPYLFMIRETGGIMTGAYIDGRNPSMLDNPYYKSNMSAEAYLIELGFINCEDDLNNLINNKDAYINAIVDSILNNYK